MVKVLNALEIKNGAKADNSRMGVLTQPVQFLLRKDKDETWGMWNMDWLELQGIKQLRRNARKLLKNYKLAIGIIDKSDYIKEEDNEMADLIDVLVKDDESAFELKFFPIIPNILNILIGEFAKRTDKIVYKSVDDKSFNEMMDKKREMIEQNLLQRGEQLMLEYAQKMGIDFNSQEGQQQMQEMMSPENIKTLPQIEDYFRKDYRSLTEEWATHQHKVDDERFKMHELELLAFRDMLIADREFWHFKMYDDDYDIEIWNPLLTFYHKSPSARYISQCNYAGQIDMLTIPDVIDKFGHKMTEEQLKSLEQIYPINGLGYILPGLQNDGSFYDATKSHEWNVEGPSLGMRQLLTHREALYNSGDDILFQIIDQSEDITFTGPLGYLRVSQIYWKSQRMLGNLIDIKPTGEIIEAIVDEDFKVTTPPIYNTKIINQKCRETLVYGQHIDWFWNNHVWGGTKIGPNRPTYYGNNTTSGFNPIYLDIRPVRFQFKGDFTTMGCKLPVEGAVFTDRNTKSLSLVDKLKPSQIGFNLVNNQIADILIDELGVVILLDQNALPKSSMGETWGKNNFAKAYVAMKNFQMLPLDTSLANTENATNFQHYQKLDLAQTERLLSRIQLANYFKQQAFELVGISPQRAGTITSQETATGIEQAINMSYAQTETYFIQHSENLMPRIHQMRTDLAQYYQSNKPSVRLQYMTSMDERINFEMFGTELLLRDINVFCTTKVNYRQMMEKIESLALSNNTSGASIFDLGNIIKAESMAEMDNVMKGIEDKTNKRLMQEQQHEAELEQMRQSEENKRLEAKLRWDAEQKALDRANDIEIAEIRAATTTGMMDVNKNSQNDYIDTLKYLDEKNNKNEDRILQREKELNKQISDDKQLALKKEELNTRKQIADKQLQIAAVNKNKYDTKSKK